MAQPLPKDSFGNQPSPRPDDACSSRRGESILQVHPFGDLDVTVLTRSIKRSDHAAFTQLYRALFTPLYRYLLVCCRGQEHLAQEVLQETMIRLTQRMQAFDCPVELWRWIRCMARHLLIDHLRKIQRRPVHQSLSEDLDWVQEQSEADGLAEWIEHLHHCLDQLDPEERSLIQGKYRQDKAHAILAKEHGVTAKAVESRLARIRKKLKTLMLKRLA